MIIIYIYIPVFLFFPFSDADLVGAVILAVAGGRRGGRGNV